MSLFAGAVLALGTIVSATPLDDLDYKGLTGDHNSITSPYSSSVYLGWAMASAIALVVTGVLPIVSWFATYRLSLSSAICVGIFAGKFLNHNLLMLSRFIFSQLQVELVGIIVLCYILFASCSV